MTRLPTPLHRPYRAASRSYTPQSVGDLALWYPIDGRLWQDSARTIPTGVGEPVGARDDYSGNARHALQSNTLKKPTLNPLGPGVQFDGVDDLMTTTYALSPASQFAIMTTIWGKDSSDQFTLTPLVGLKPNLVNEFAVLIETGDNLELAMPANWDPNVWIIQGLLVPTIASGTAEVGNIVSFVKDAVNYIQIRREADNTLTVGVRVAGNTFGHPAISLPAFAAGSVVWFQAILSSGNLSVYVDTNLDGSFESVSTAGIPNFASSAGWTAKIGRDPTTITDHFQGSVNLIVNINGASLGSRFNGGAGMAISDWLGTYAESLVLHVGGNDDGTALQLDTFAGAQQIVSNTGFETDASGWSALNANISRSTAQAKAGAASLLVDPTVINAQASPNPGGTLFSNRWAYFKASVYPLVSSVAMQGSTIVRAFTKTASTIGAWNDLRAASRVIGGGAFTAVEFLGGADTDDFYLDEVTVQQLSILTPTVAAKGVPSRVIISASKGGFVGPYIFVGISGAERIRIGYRNDAGAIVQAEAAGSVTIAQHSISLEFDGTTLRAYVDTVLAVSLAVAGTFTGIDTVVLGGLKTTTETRSFDERIGDTSLHPGRVYTAIERKRLHNEYLVPLTTGLVAV